jgi:hypothetical protein
MEERRLWMFENSVLRRMFGPKRVEVKGGLRKLHNEELHKLYFSPSIIRMSESRRIRWAGKAACIRAKKKAHMVFMGKPEGKRPLGRPRHRLKDKIEDTLEK